MSFRDILKTNKDYKKVLRMVNKYNKKVLRNMTGVTLYHFKKFVSQMNGQYNEENQTGSFTYGNAVYYVTYCNDRINLNRIVSYVLGDTSKNICMD